MKSSFSGRSILALSLMGVLVLGCTEKDTDEDGLTDAEEEEMGLDPESSDSDGDGIDDGDELDMGLDPLSADSDGDGLDDGAELELGLDPLNPDQDGDSYTDGAEVEAGTNPFYAYSHPYIGGYSVGNCEAGEPVPTGPTGEGSYSSSRWDAYQIGDVMENFTMLDQHGEMVDLYSFCGNFVHIEVGAFW